MAEKIDPYDVKALEGAVNDSATRVSAIWISFLVFSLYLLIAATTVTQRQLLLAESVKLPVLNIELPLWGFFFLAPILFVILHAYVLLQVLLLGRTTAAYNAAVARLSLSPEENISLRQRLANTLFAQIFAGSPRERDGFIGWLLRAIVWITLAIAPILIVLAFQFSFLAYHSHIATWTHRLLILVELAAFFLIWPLALDAQRDFQWPKVGADVRRLASLAWGLAVPKEQRHDEWLWLREQAVPLAACLLFIIVSLSIATFPGEPHVNLVTGRPLFSVECYRWIQRNFEYMDLRFDRLHAPNVDVVDDRRFTQILHQASERNMLPSQGERTQNFSVRDFNCGDLSSADLRRVDLTGAHMMGARLYSADLQGATLTDAWLQGAEFDHADLRGANLRDVRLQGAFFFRADLQGVVNFNADQLKYGKFGGASLPGIDLSGSTDLQGIDLRDTDLQGANLKDASLQGSNLEGARLQGVNLSFARLQGANLSSAQLQGANLSFARLQGADFSFAQLQGANLSSAQLQGAELRFAQLQGADLSGASLESTELAAVQLQGADLALAVQYICMACDGCPMLRYSHYRSQS